MLCLGTLHHSACSNVKEYIHLYSNGYEAHCQATSILKVCGRCVDLSLLKFPGCTNVQLLMRFAAATYLPLPVGGIIPRLVLFSLRLVEGMRHGFVDALSPAQTLL